jgi:hypothetical protein
MHTLQSTYVSLEPLIASLPRSPSPTLSTFLLTLSLPSYPFNLGALRQRLHEFTPEDHLSDSLVDTVVMPYWRSVHREGGLGGGEEEVKQLMQGFICACGEYWMKERLLKD